MIIGMDFGSTATKIVLMDDKKVVEKYRIEKDDDYMEVLQKMDLSKVSKIMTVGAGASFIDHDIAGIKTETIDEFHAIALGGHYLSGLDKCIVVSVGTGTSFTYVNKEKREHTGGCGMGGALLYSLGKNCLGIENVNELLELATKGKIENADLQIRDISKWDIDNLYGGVTVANMAKIDESSSREDYAFGICNMVFQNIGVMSVMVDRNYGTGKIVIMGSVGQSEVAKDCFYGVGGLFGCDFVIPDDSVYGVAIGAALLG